MDSPYTEKDPNALRYLESILVLIKVSIGGIAFGVWQHSYAAWIFSSCFLALLGNIGWAIEWGYHNFENKQ